MTKHINVPEFAEGGVIKGQGSKSSDEFIQRLDITGCFNGTFYLSLKDMKNIKLPDMNFRQVKNHENVGEKD